MNDGYNASVTFGTKFPKQEQNLGFSLNRQQKKLGISAYGGGFSRNQPEIDYRNEQQTIANLLDQKGKTSNKGSGGYFNTSVTYEIDSLQLLNVQLGSNFTNSRSKDNVDSYFYQQNDLSSGSTSSNDSESKGHGFETSANYQIGFRKDKSQFLTLSYRFNTYDYKIASDSDIRNIITTSLNNINQTNDNRNSEHTFQIDFVKNIKKVNLESGLKAIIRKNSSDYTTIPENKDNSDEFTNLQNIYGAYVSLRFSLWKWDFQTGLRVETTNTQVDFTGTNTHADQSYFNLIPNISISKNWKEHHTVNFGFSQRIKRPGIIRLNPFVNRSNPYFETAGNPYLKPVINNEVMAGYSFNKKINLNMSLSYSFSNKVDLKVSSYDPSSHVTKTTYENSNKAGRLGVDYYLNYPVTKKLILTVNGNAAVFFINGIVDNLYIKNDLFTYYLYLSANYQFENNWKIGSNIDFTSKMPAGLQKTTNAFTGLSFNISKSILDNQLTFSAFANNPFNTFRQSVTETNGGNFYQNSYIRDYYRSFGLNISYKFGKLKDEIKTTQRSIRNTDLSN